MIETKNLKDVYLLIARCEEDGYWDTSGYCHWSKPAFYSESKFELDDEESLIDSIAKFMSDYPRGEYELYIVKEIDWYDNEEQKEYFSKIHRKARDLSEKIKEEAELRKKELQTLERKRAEQDTISRDLKKLEELKRKYEL